MSQSPNVLSIDISPSVISHKCLFYRYIARCLFCRMSLLLVYRQCRCVLMSLLLTHRQGRCVRMSLPLTHRHMSLCRCVFYIYTLPHVGMSVSLLYSHIARCRCLQVSPISTHRRMSLLPCVFSIGFYPVFLCPYVFLSGPSPSVTDSELVVIGVCVNTIRRTML